MHNGIGVLFDEVSMKLPVVQKKACDKDEKIKMLEQRLALSVSNGRILKKEMSKLKKAAGKARKERNFLSVHNLQAAIGLIRTSIDMVKQ